MVALKLRILFLLFSIVVSECYKLKNPSLYLLKTVQPSRGEVWPKPQRIKTFTTVLSLKPEQFLFVNAGKKCPIVEDACNRYYDVIFNPPRKPRYSRDQSKNSVNTVDQLENESTRTVKALKLHLKSTKCETWPYMGMDEKYDLQIDQNGTANLYSYSVWGLLRGLETFSQLVYGDRKTNYFVNATRIHDFPRFPYRGLLLDTSRHYVPTKYILQNLDAMAQSKYNVFHWHIVDDTSFPYQSQRFPNISALGAFAPTHIYTKSDIVEIIEFARLRGIRVISEFDTPGHTQSWGPGVPDLLTPCYANVSGQHRITSYGPINPVVNSTYHFLRNFFTEIARLFPDKYIHLGGDEVSFSCWQSNPAITKFMKEHEFDQDYRKLESYYFSKLLKILKDIRKSYLVWQEVFDNKVNLKKDTIVHVWKPTPNPMAEMMAVTKAGYRAILSTCWYLNDFTMGNDWVSFYPCEPMEFNGTKRQMDLVVGGETCLWGEYVDATNMMARLWPRALAPAERLWSNRNVNDTKAATPRFEEHRCRMVTRGINAQPVNGPSFCPSDYLI